MFPTKVKIPLIRPQTESSSEWAEAIPERPQRFTYFRKEGREPDYPAYDDTVCHVVMMSELPGAGKDFWVAENLLGLPVISPDALRDEGRTDGQPGSGRVESEGGGARVPAQAAALGVERHQH